MKLKQRIALIVGAGNGLGRAIALAFSNEGAFVCVADLNAAAAHETLMLCGGPDRGMALRMDASQPDEIQREFAAVAQAYGRLDLMVNCAALCLVDPVLELSPERWGRVFDLNARGAFFCMQAAAKAMIPNKFGRIITISTPSAKMAFPLFATYGASKAAVDSLTKSCAVAWAPNGITVNTIVPGRMTGGMVDVLEQDLAKITSTPAGSLAADRTKGLPMGRRVDPAEVASAAVWLASDEAAYVTAERLNFTGGMELQ